MKLPKLKSKFSIIEGICAFAVLIGVNYLWEVIPSREFTYKNIFISETANPFAFWLMVAFMSFVTIFALYGALFMEFDKRNYK
ncbi:hypothetical protein AAD001_17120 [Colwelliaceae bacterium 6471]|uniref:hypothetical protein n=1 Tax=Thalassotalea atypica TaxID=2054316 RepID=UPI002572E913|nr:hypothetical protein [Thalassotalea atypica]